MSTGPANDDTDISIDNTTSMDLMVRITTSCLSRFFLVDEFSVAAAKGCRTTTEKCLTGGLI
jgi:hypothetical protein